MSQHHKSGAQKRKERKQREENETRGLQTLFKVGVNKSTTDDATSSSNIQPEFSTAGIDNDKPTDMELDDVASEGTAGEESSSGCNSNDQTNQSKTMKERMTEISEEPTSNHNDTKHTNATSLDIGLLQAECPSNPDIEEYVIRCHIGLPKHSSKGQKWPGISTKHT